ncbi:hypothetical protein Tco_0697869 [Tanacetum coccineum]
MALCSFLTPLSVIQEESDILWKLTLLFPDLRVMVPVSNLIVALAVVRNGVPKMKGLFSFSLISKITKPFVDKSHVGGVGHNVHIGPLIDEGVHVLKVPYAAGYFEIPSDVLILCYLFLKNRFISRSPRGSAGREFLEKPEHFSHPTIDFLTLLKDSVLKSLHSFSVRSYVIPYLSLEKVNMVLELEKSPVRCFRDALRCRNGLDRFDEFFCFIPTFMVVKGEVLNDFLRFVGVLIMEFAAGGAVNFILKMKGDMIIENLDLKPTIDAMMRDLSPPFREILNICPKVSGKAFDEPPTEEEALSFITSLKKISLSQ